MSLFLINFDVKKLIFEFRLIPGGLLLIGALWIKESPRWLVSQGRREEAIKNLSYLRKLQPEDQYMIEEIYAMDQAHQEVVGSIGTGFWAPFKALFSSRSLMKRMLLGVSLFAWYV